MLKKWWVKPASLDMNIVINAKRHFEGMLTELEKINDRVSRSAHQAYEIN